MDARRRGDGVAATWSIQVGCLAALLLGDGCCWGTRCWERGVVSRRGQLSIWPRDGNPIHTTKPPLPLDLSHEEQLLLALARGWRLVVQERRWGLHDSHRSVLSFASGLSMPIAFIVRVFGQCVIGTCGL